MIVTVHKFVLRTYAMIEIEFEGRRLQAREGESLAAALTAHGIRDFRTTRCGAERGIFCGMGVCQDCLVEVDGRANERACMTIVDRPLVVRREVLCAAAAAEIRSACQLSQMSKPHRPELLIIGAGPGGLERGDRGAACGLRGDRSSMSARMPAGNISSSFRSRAPTPPDAQHREGLRLIETARELGVEFEERVTVWGAFPPNEFGASSSGRARRYLPRATIIATGAYERGWPVPGWTLPGVMTTGAAQTLWRTARRLPGKRVLIAGNGPLNLQLAAELIEGGAEVAAVVEAAAKPGLAQLPALLAMLTAAPGLVRDGLQVSRAAPRRTCADDLRRRRHCDREDGDGIAASIGSEVFDVDVVCLGYGFEPSNELLRALGCTHDFDAQAPPARDALRREWPDRHGRRLCAGRLHRAWRCPRCDGARDTGRPRRGGIAWARDDGRVAAAARESFGRARRGIASFKQALWDIYAAPAYSAKLATPETLICRCEEVSFGDVDAALDEGLEGLGAVKRRTRIGMGRCQGRYCAPRARCIARGRAAAGRAANSPAWRRGHPPSRCGSAIWFRRKYTS